MATGLSRLSELNELREPRELREPPELRELSGSSELSAPSDPCDARTDSTRSSNWSHVDRLGSALVCIAVVVALTSAGTSIAASDGITASALAYPPGTFVLKSAPLRTAALMSASAPPFILAQDALNLEEKEGYSTEYIFGLSKGTMRSTLVPALKPFVLIFTIPLDLVFLPFAAIAGAL